MKLLKIVVLILSTYLIIVSIMQLFGWDDNIQQFHIEGLNFIVATAVLILVLVMRSMRRSRNQEHDENK